MYELPKSVVIGGETFEIRSDYRDILEIIRVLHNDTLICGILGDEKAHVSMTIFYPDFELITDYEAAWRALCRFIDRDESHGLLDAKTPLYDFEKDESLIVPAVGRVLGTRIREEKYIHWWDFIDAFGEIGDGLFAQVVGVRNRKRKGKMSKEDRLYYRENAALIDRVRPHAAAPQTVKRLSPEEGEEAIRRWRMGVKNRGK